MSIFFILHDNDSCASDYNSVYLLREKRCEDSQGKSIAIYPEQKQISVRNVIEFLKKNTVLIQNRLHITAEMNKFWGFEQFTAEICGKF